MHRLTDYYRGVKGKRVKAENLKEITFKFTWYFHSGKERQLDLKAKINKNADVYTVLKRGTMYLNKFRLTERVKYITFWGVNDFAGVDILRDNNGTYGLGTSVDMLEIMGIIEL